MQIRDTNQIHAHNSQGSQPVNSYSHLKLPSVPEMKTLYGERSIL